MRGLPASPQTEEGHQPLVPAHAGVTRRLAESGRGRQARPRTCGGYPCAIRFRETPECSSPHMRGLPALNASDNIAGNLVPAHAGVTRSRRHSSRWAATRPRTCGGYPARPIQAGHRQSSSPHMRGLPEFWDLEITTAALVPAHAGVTRSWFSLSAVA